MQLSSFFPFISVSLCWALKNLIIHQLKAELLKKKKWFLLLQQHFWVEIFHLLGAAKTLKYQFWIEMLNFELKCQFLCPAGSPPLLQSAGAAGQGWAGPGGQWKGPGVVPEKPRRAQGTRPAEWENQKEPPRKRR